MRQGEPNKAEKTKVWKTAIGLQQVDGLKPSDYLLATARKNIECDISIDEVKQLIDSYYKQHPKKDTQNRTEEADKVSTPIAEILSEHTFTFSPVEYSTIHRRLFQGVYGYLSKGIYKIEKYLIRFLSNLLLGGNHSLTTREMHVIYIGTVKTNNDTVK